MLISLGNSIRKTDDTPVCNVLACLLQLPVGVFPRYDLHCSYHLERAIYGKFIAFVEVVVEAITMTTTHCSLKNRLSAELTVLIRKKHPKRWHTQSTCNPWYGTRYRRSTLKGKKASIEQCNIKLGWNIKL